MLDPAPADSNLQWLQAPSHCLPAALLERMRRHQLDLEQLCRQWAPNDSSATCSLLGALDRCLVMSPLRRGRWGVGAIHQALLGEAATRSPQHWPLGTPVLCRHNLLDLGLANGDVGLVVEHGGGGSAAAAPIGRDITLQAMFKGTPPLEAYPSNVRGRIAEQQERIQQHVPAGGMTNDRA
jgi:hypothetical protein